MPPDADRRTEGDGNEMKNKTGIELITEERQRQIEVEGFNADDFPWIVGDYEDLLYHDGPLLFTGKTKDGRRVVGSLAKMDVSEDRYFHAVLSDDAYKLFEAGEVSLRTAYQDAPFLAIVSVFDKGEEPNTREIQFADAPEDELPTEESYLPRSVGEINRG